MVWQVMPDSGSLNTAYCLTPDSGKRPEGGYRGPITLDS